jgi:hypothetical protein
MTIRTLVLAVAAAAASFGQIRVGIIGTDTSHVPAFTRALNDSKYADYIPGAKVVAAYKGGSPDVESSRTRVDNYAKEISEKYGVEIVPDIKTLLTKVDAVLIESVDGRAHLPQAREVIKAGKPFFVDKPLSSTLADAQEIARLAAAAKVPFFSSSSLRYAQFVLDLKAGGDVAGAITWSPGPVEEHHALDLSWYGIHGVETLYALMGQGCEELTRTSTPDADEVTCRWKDGRLGSLRVMRPYGGYGAVVFRKDRTVSQSPAKISTNYIPLVKEIVKFFQSGKPPVDPAETIEIMEFMDAAQRSKTAGGKPVRLR